jgi:hypothetical protein
VALGATQRFDAAKLSRLRTLNVAVVRTITSASQSGAFNSWAQCQSVRRFQLLGPMPVSQALLTPGPSASQSGAFNSWAQCTSVRRFQLLGPVPVSQALSTPGPSASQSGALNSWAQCKSVRRSQLLGPARNPVVLRPCNLNPQPSTRDVNPKTPESQIS